MSGDDTNNAPSGPEVEFGQRVRDVYAADGFDAMIAFVQFEHSVAQANIQNLKWKLTAKSMGRGGSGSERSADAQVPLWTPPQRPAPAAPVESDAAPVSDDDDPIDPDTLVRLSELNAIHQRGKELDRIIAAKKADLAKAQREKLKAQEKARGKAKVGRNRRVLDEDLPNVTHVDRVRFIVRPNGRRRRPRNVDRQGLWSVIEWRRHRLFKQPVPSPVRLQDQPTGAAMRSFARGRSAVQQEVVEQVARAVESIFLEAPENWTVASAEKAVWTLILDVGRDILGALLAEASRARSEAYATARYHPDEWRFRLDERSDAVVATTLGVVTFPWFAIRFLAPGGKEKTCNPAQRALMPYYRRARSSPALLKWECALGSREPFRRAEVSLTRFTNGAVTLEDTTIARHTVAIGKSIDRSWLYRDRDDIHRVVLERATRCRKTGRPLVYVSSDAHAVRRYVDDTWAAEWKMLNGIRVWCVDRDSGDLIHVGGEYTWGDCREVAASLKGAMDAGYLPPDGDFGGATRALYVWLSDGMPWFDDHLLPLFEPDALIVVLDAYHVLGRIRAFATKAHRTAKQKAKTLYAQLATLIVGKKPQCAISTTAPAEPKYPDASGFTDYPAMVIARVRNVALLRTSRVSARDDLADYLESNGHRIDYADYRARGISIGSGPMESFHRTASQARLKIPGARWTTETSQAILNLRLVEIVGKTDRFWDRSDIVDHITHALAA